MRNFFKAALVALGMVGFTYAVAPKEKVKMVKAAASKVEWLGKKITGQHTGVIHLKSGNVILNDKNKLVGGTFIVDMTTIKVTDLEGEWKQKLERHLNSEDFFATEQFKESKFVITKVVGNQVSGNLTIKGITLPQTFKLQLAKNVLSGTIVIDRTKYDIRYGSSSFFDNLQDKAINDEFELKLHIVF